MVPRWWIHQWTTGSRLDRGAGASAFQGVGHRLGDTPTSSSEPVAATGVLRRPPSVSRVLKMWQDGFSIDDGPLHAYDDPGSQVFLQAIRRGEIPRELLQEASGAEVNLNMEDHRLEQYVGPPRPKVTAFEGAGHRLGTMTPTLTRPANSNLPPEQAEANAKAGIGLDESKPTTNIQIRLSDGSRYGALELSNFFFCPSYAVAIVNARPEYEAATFLLLTTFPHKELTDENATLKDANLLNAVIVQRLK
ncbi:hypothetical protein HPB51_017738 [Rhipicephalus microplus]|uniref:NSFL1 cofactor p47 n=1 Tax=Rhipicephalus microplus TaxID=6941 RepID=A0A9J6ENR1_RHIMP|nr:hypothetical protein HPB51_017738 [Rhipicephalus microplus]